MDLGALYEEVILDHNRAPRNWGELAGATARVEGHNPLCGDQVTLWLKVDGAVIREARFVGEGCAISKASASMMTQAITGKTTAEAETMMGEFFDLVTGKAGTAAPTSLGKLRAFGGVSRFPARVKCASMPWHALRRALQDGERGEAGRAP